ncbi:MAG: PAS domain-containing sensor histidine kinase, partial [Desulfohalobiaceae bacterium]
MPQDQNSDPKVQAARDKLLRLSLESSHKSYYPQLRQQLERLRQSGEDLSVTLNSIGEGVIATDRQGRITRMNPTAESLTGWSQTEAKGRHLGEVFHIVNAHTRGACQDPVQKVLESGKIQGLANDTLLLSRQGREYQIADSAAPIQDGTGGEVRGVVLVFRDVSQEYSMRKALEASEAAYRDLFQNAPVGIFRSTSQGRLLQANPSMAKLLGWASPEEAVFYYQDLGRQIYQDLETREKFISILQEKGQVQGFEHQALCQDGQTRWLSINARVSEYYGPWDFVLDGFVWDITPRKEQESHLKQTRRLLDEIIEFLPDATLVIDTQGKVLAWNRAIEELTGVGKEEMLGKGDYEYSRLLYGRPCPILVDIVLADSGKRPGLEKTYEYISWREEILYGEAYAPAVHNGKGAYLWGAAGTLRDGSGNLIGAIESIRDVSERKQVEKRLQESEELYRSITENTFDLTCLLELSGHYIYHNTRYLDVMGYSSQELLGCNVLKIIHPEDQEKVMQALQQGVAEGWDQHRLSFRMRCKDGSYKWLDNRARLLKDEQGRPQRILAVGQDITEHRKLEQQLQQARKMEAVGTLAGGIAHDFNNILQVINGYANILLQECAVQNSDRNKLQQILRSGQYGAELVRKLLAFSRKLEGQKRPLDLNQEVQETVQILRSTLPKMIDIQLSLEQDLWPVEADRNQVQQVLMNL